ncbi:DNA internalization-related competence protein ComEC/Rec2 [Selenomonas flueggei]|uniref:DNA internalization-related competence protein ComEC/Rec2 n=1 Tax=Selenomonas flueggei TaxID=135080 RepID=UPI002671FC4C|nr:DNA internalization-related competence protein ComEC/Rec2 [Selenomonas flueggei]
MKTGQHPLRFLMGLLAAFCLGIICGACGGISLSVHLIYLISAVPILFSASVILVLKQHERTWITFVGLFFVAGMFRFAGAYELPVQDISHAAGEETHVAGIITEMPRVTERTDGTRQIRYTVVVHTLGRGSTERAASGQLLLYERVDVDMPQDVGRIGDRITAEGKIRRPHGYQNPGQIDTALLLRTQGITASLSARRGSVSIESRDDISLWEQWMRRAAEIRTHYLERMRAVMPRTDAAAIFAMLFGGYEGIDPALLEAYTTTGIVHILSVSGSHISLIAAVIAWIAVILRLPRWFGAAVVISAIFFYVLLAGMVPPAVRSGMMGGAAFLGLVLGRERDAKYLLLLTGLFMLMVSPLLLFHISFQLSFLATAGLLFLAPVLAAKMHRLPRLVSMAFSITIAAQLMVLPVLAWYFNQVSISALLANLVVVPIVELIIIMGLFAGIVAYLLPLFGGILFAADSVLLGISFELTRALAAFPLSKVWLPSIGIVPSVCYYAVILMLCAPTEMRRKILSRFLAYRRIAAVLCLALLVGVCAWRMVMPREMAVHFIDVGQGDCALVVTPHGHAMLFDTGGTRDSAFDIGARVDVPYLLHYGVREVDYIFLSHAHEDHAAGAGAILSRLPVKHVYTADEGRHAYAMSMRLGDANPLLSKLSRAAAGDTFVLDGVTVEVLYAPALDPLDNATGNEVSNVYRIRYGDASFLFTGDLIREHEQRMLAAGTDASATVLKIPHHGSHTSSSEEFIRAVHPMYAVYCVGAGNSFGHPHADVVERYKQMQVKTLRTDEDGAIVFRTDGHHLFVETFADGKILHN